MSPYRDPTGTADAARTDLLICAGLDPSGGAGLIADVRVASMLGTRPVGVVTALTIQNTQGVRSSHPIDADVLGAQLATLLSDVEVRAVKLGMLGAIDIARELGDALHLTAAPVVWDPISAPTLGNIAFDRGLFEEQLAELAPHLTLITPNAHELGELTGLPIRDLPTAIAAARALAARCEAAVLVKGGHLTADPSEATDVLIDREVVETFRGPRIVDGEHVHGTGCMLSTAIAAHLALGANLVEACRAAKELVAARIAAPVRPGRGAAAVV
jgi:hydroxymethylpyrimidine/phosphomethylpyrimidine kinase